MLMVTYNTNHQSDGIHRIYVKRKERSITIPTVRIIIPYSCRHCIWLYQFIIGKTIIKEPDSIVRSFDSNKNSIKNEFSSQNNSWNNDPSQYYRSHFCTLVMAVNVKVMEVTYTPHSSKVDCSIRLATLNVFLKKACRVYFCYWNGRLLRKHFRGTEDLFCLYFGGIA